MALKIMEKIAQKKIIIYILSENAIGEAKIDVTGHIGKITLTAPSECRLMALSPKNYATELPLDNNNEWSGAPSEIRNHRIFAIRNKLSETGESTSFRFPYELPIRTVYDDTLYAKLVVVVNTKADILSPVKLLEKFAKPTTIYDVSEHIYSAIEEALGDPFAAYGGAAMTETEYAMTLSSLDTDSLTARINEGLSELGIVITEISLSTDGPYDRNDSVAWSSYKKELERDAEHREEIRKIKKDREFLEEFEKNSDIANKVRREKFLD